MTTVTFDVDGTLADVSHRRHFVTGEEKTGPCSMQKWVRTN